MDILDRVRNEVHLVGSDAQDYLHKAMDLMQSWGGWIGRHWYMVLPGMYALGYVTRMLVEHGK